MVALETFNPSCPAKERRVEFIVYCPQHVYRPPPSSKAVGYMITVIYKYCVFSIEQFHKVNFHYSYITD